MTGVQTCALPICEIREYSSNLFKSFALFSSHSLKSFDNKILEKAGCNFKKSEIREYLKTKLFNECEENKESF